MSLFDQTALMAITALVLVSLIGWFVIASDQARLDAEADVMMDVVDDLYRERYTHTMITTYTCLPVGTGVGEVDVGTTLTFGACQLPGVTYAARVREQTSSCTAVNIADLQDVNRKVEALTHPDHANWEMNWDIGRQEGVLRHVNVRTNEIDFRRNWQAPIRSDKTIALEVDDTLYAHGVGELYAGEQSGTTGAVVAADGVSCASL